MQKIIFLIATCALAMLAFKNSESFIVTGKVTDKEGNPISFATVKIKGSASGLSADAKGEFSIRVNSEDDVLVFSGAAFKTVEITVGTQRKLVIVLEQAVYSDLREVVVTGGYGTKRSMKTSSSNIRKIRGKKLLNSTNQGNSLTGKAAGIQLRGQSGAILQDVEYLDREGYDHIIENGFLKVTNNPLSTFSIDVDAASYSNLRRYLKSGQWPPAGAVRIEEMINYFRYEYPQPKASDPFSVTTEISTCPWNPLHRLALIGLQGKIIPVQDLPAANIVFLIDVSGSMGSEDKLPLLKQSLKLLTDQLRENDKVSLVVYAGRAGLVLPATNGSEKQTIKDAINALESGGSTAGGAGIKLAYKTAAENFISNGNNRVILCTDGDFNVGMSSDDELEKMIEKEREDGVFLTVLGFGTGNYQDSKMQKLADKGNGNHAYIDQLSEAKKVLVSEFGGTLFTIAKDVKLQIEFNPGIVQGYRLIGYENRMLSEEDFNDDKKDAGEMGSGHTVTALYEIIPVRVQSEFLRQVDSLKYQVIERFSATAFNNEMMTLKLRYKLPDGKTSKLMVVPVLDQQTSIQFTSTNFRFAAAVSEFGMLLRNSAYKQQSSFAGVISLANNAMGSDKGQYRKEFMQLVKSANSMVKKSEKRKIITGDESESLSKKQ